jgi:ribulose-5-phosphate 4-epimerase/fuculose-1-phosphate aldolase
MSLTKDDLVAVDLEGNVIEGDLKPSIEVYAHLAIYKVRPDVNAVIHAHAPYVMGATISGFLENTHGEAAAILGDVKIVPYAHPGTRELAKLMEEAFKGEGMKVPRVAITLNHGAFSAGACIHEARAFMEILDEWARFNVASKALGGIKHKLTLLDLRKPGAGYIRAVKFGGRKGPLECVKGVVEPETGIPAVSLGLVRVEGRTLYYRPISPYAPQMLVIAMGLQLLTEGMKCGMHVRIENYYLEEELNKRFEAIERELSRVLGP